MNKLLMILVVALGVVCVWQGFIIADHSGRVYEIDTGPKHEYRFYDASPIPFQEDFERGDDGKIESWSVGLRYDYNYLGNFTATLSKSDLKGSFDKLSVQIFKENGTVATFFKDSDGDRNPDSMSFLVMQSGEKPARYSDFNLDGAFDTRYYQGKSYILIENTWKEIGKGGTRDDVEFPKRVLAETGEEYTFASGRWIPSSEL